jgi:hypothetical protein
MDTASAFLRSKRSRKSEPTMPASAADSVYAPPR